MQYATLAASISELEIWAWVYWVRVWLGLSCDMEAEDNIEEPAPHYSNRAQRRWIAYYCRCGSPIADKLYVLRMMLPAGLTENQKLERLSHLSKMGRVRIYGMNFWGSVLQRRAQLICYNHGWWRKPMLCALAEPSRPPLTRQNNVHN